MQAPGHSLISPTPRWLHCSAIFTVLLHSSLLIARRRGDHQKGRHDRSAPLRSPWHLVKVLSNTAELQHYRKKAWDFGWVIEHSHRTAGWLVGLFRSCLAIGLWLFERRPWLRWAGIAAHLAVTLKGFWAYYRVKLGSDSILWQRPWH